jgi:hypothetical protein
MGSSTSSTHSFEGDSSTNTAAVVGTKSISNINNPQHLNDPHLQQQQQQQPPTHEQQQAALSQHLQQQQQQPHLFNKRVLSAAVAPHNASQQQHFPFQMQQLQVQQQQVQQVQQQQLLSVPPVGSRGKTLAPQVALLPAPPSSSSSVSTQPLLPAPSSSALPSAIPLLPAPVPAVAAVAVAAAVGGSSTGAGVGGSAVTHTGLDPLLDDEEVTFDEDMALNFFAGVDAAEAF